MTAETRPELHEENGFSQVGGHRLAWRWLRHEQQPQRAPLVFLHDSLGCVATWRDFPARLAELSGRDALIYERLGYGGSDPFDRARDVDYLEREATEFLPAVLDDQEIGRAVLFGHSDGGSIALLAAALRPERVVGIVTEGAHIFNEDLTREGVRAAQRAYTETDIAARLVKYHGDKVPALYSAWVETWLAPWYHDWNVEHLLPRIRCPALIVQGEDDEFGSLAQVERTVAAIGKEAQALILPECGHTPHKEARAALESVLLPFVAALPE